MLRRLVPSAYRPVLANGVSRRLILGFAVSYLADAMSFVAVAWLAIEVRGETGDGTDQESRSAGPEPQLA